MKKVELLNLKGEKVKAKKYFYVLRPVLACRWIFDKGTPPPMLFSELVETELPKAILTEIESLLELKTKSPEIKMIPRIDRINEYLDESIVEIKSILKSMYEENQVKWSELNRLFIKSIN